MKLIKNKAIIISIIFASLSACKSSAPVAQHPNPVSPQNKKPNIVLILTDDMRWDLMSVMNHPYLKTPTLDRLANQGVLFENAFIPFAACSPSRAALLTGREPHQASAPGIYWRNNSFLETQTTFPKILHDNGYNTAYIGKWHLGDGKHPKPGFDHWESFDALGSFWDTTLWINGIKHKFKGFSDDILSERTVKFINQASGTQNPFFVMVGFKEPHLPFASPKRFKKEFENIYIPKPDSFNEDFSISGKETFPWLDIKTAPYGIPKFGNWENFIKSHYRGILGLDSAVKKIVDVLEENGELNNTLFIYTSDNGYTLGEHGHTEKHLTYEEPIRVPMLISYPDKIPSGIRRKELVSSIDIAPTILDYAGVEIPNHMSGRSWKPLLETEQNETLTWRDQLFFWLTGIHATIRTTNYKLIKSLKTADHYELYDLKKDPKELINRYNDPAYNHIKESMLKRLSSEEKRIGWSKRKYLHLNTIYTSQVMPSATATALIKQLSSINFPAQVALPTLNNKIHWKKSSSNHKPFHFPATQSQQSIIIAIPIKRLTPWDPFVKLVFAGNPETHLYSRGKEIWNNQSKVEFNIANPPLHDKLDYAYITMNLTTQTSNVSIFLESPEGSISLPLEQKR